MTASLLTIPAWLLLSYVLMSFIEYAVHRWPMHSKSFARRFPSVWNTFEIHAVFHHGRFYRQFENDPDRLARHVGTRSDAFFNTMMLSPIWLGIGYWSPVGGATFVAFAFLHALAWTAIHAEMHEPSGRWFSRTGFFRYLREYHRVHHDFPGTNFNIICVGADHVFGTYRSCLTTT